MTLDELSAGALLLWVVEGDVEAGVGLLPEVPAADLALVSGPAVRGRALVGHYLQDEEFYV